MCGRFALKKTHLAQIAKAAAAIMSHSALPASRYNIPPGGRIPVIRHQPGGSGRELIDLHWGITTSWAGPSTRPLTNARAETVSEKPTFRDAFNRRRCLVPVSAFYEWQSTGSRRHPWAFCRPDHDAFCLGAIWEADCCAIVTTAANTVVSPIHHRMPVLLTSPDDFAAWLDPLASSSSAPGRLASLLAPAEEDKLIAHPVSTRINNVRHDDEACLAETTPAADNQLELGW